MTSGIVFDIREFAIHDGPGIRTTVFLKGCPLRCSWCHNPEGISSEPQILRSPAGERVVGKPYTAQEIAGILNKQAEIFLTNDGGVTFSGGEPLQQAAFVSEIIDLLDNRVHKLLDTSGYGSEQSFRLLAGRCNMVHFDIKLMDPEAHQRYTGRDNFPILRNLRILGRMKTPFIARVPLIPGVTDNDSNLAAIAAAVRELPNLIRVDMLPYNYAAGGKYGLVGMDFSPGFDESALPKVNTEIFTRESVEVRVA